MISTRTRGNVMGRKLRITAGIAAAAIGALYIGNANWRAAPPDDAKVEIIAHRGIHQTYRREDLDSDTCTAGRIAPPTHDLIENTIASMQAAFAAGADIVELDVHPTTDGQFAVFHDWTLDCRTEGAGKTRDHAMAYLKTLDIGYGYSADGGKTFPLRGRGTGLMPELKEVFSAMPDKRFLVNFKSRETREGDMLVDLITANAHWAPAVWGAYGGDEPTSRAKARQPELHVLSRKALKDCLLRYIGLGWSGHIPSACRDTTIMVPLNAAPLLWGWPHLFGQRCGMPAARSSWSALIRPGIQAFRVSIPVMTPQ
jgi:glycerophosphoryl diester phosphodiesterase